MKIILIFVLAYLFFGTAYAQVAETDNANVASAAECATLKKKMYPFIPANVTPAARHEMDMYSALIAIQLVDEGCYSKGPPEEVAKARESYRRSYLASQYACNKLKTDGSKCIAQDHASTNFEELRQRENPEVNSTNQKVGMSSKECEVRKQAVAAVNIPDGASLTESLETVMFMTKGTLDMIDGGCPTESGVTQDQIAAEKQLRKQQYDSSESACNAAQSGGRKCVARNHFGPGTEAHSSRIPVSPAVKPEPSRTDFDCEPDPNNIGRSKDRYKVVAYDPVLGKLRCVNEPESTPPKQSGMRKTSSDWETSPGAYK